MTATETANDPRPLPPAGLRCFTSEHYYVELPPGHVFPMAKFPLSARRLVEDGTICATTDPGTIGDDDLLRVHTAAYVRSVDTGEFNDLTRRKLGLPPSAALARRSRCAVAGTLAAARAAMADGIACNLAGGTHHAFADSGQGFCVYNDVAVAVAALRREEPYLHAMVIDLDAHQGNGTHALLAPDPLAFTYSLHVGRNYPSKKVPGDLDVPVSRWASADEYFTQLEQTLPRAVEAFEPDVAFYIAGVDPHAADRFGQMKLSTTDLRHRDERAIDLCRNWGIPVVVLYGGGYQPTAAATADLHCQTVRVAAARWHRELTD